MTDKIVIDKSKPYTLLKGDALELLPLFEPNTFDAVITDPPYASGSTTTKGRMMTTARKYTNAKVNNPLPNFAGDQQDQLSWTVWTIMWMNRVKDVLREGGVFAFFIDWRQLPAMSIALQIAGLTWRGIMVWDKRNSRPQKGRPKQQTEYILWGSKGKLDINRNVPVLPGLYSYSNVQGVKRLHQTQKPLQLMRDIIKLCEPHSLILDPFAGSGSTLHAAILEGHTAVGIEKTESYYEIADERLKGLFAPDNEE